MKNTKKSNRIFCDHCESNALPDLIDKYKKTTTNTYFRNLISKWDNLKIPNTAIDIVG